MGDAVRNEVAMLMKVVLLAAAAVVVAGAG
jgi:hypothetical protein